MIDARLALDVGDSLIVLFFSICAVSGAFYLADSAVRWVIGRLKK